MSKLIVIWHVGVISIHKSLETDILVKCSWNATFVVKKNI